MQSNVAIGEMPFSPVTQAREHSKLAQTVLRTKLSAMSLI